MADSNYQLTPELAAIMQQVLGLGETSDQDAALQEQMAVAMRLMDTQRQHSTGAGAGLLNGLIQGVKQGKGFADMGDARTRQQANIASRAKVYPDIAKALFGGQEPFQGSVQSPQEIIFGD